MLHNHSGDDGDDDDDDDDATTRMNEIARRQMFMNVTLRKAL